MTIIGRVRNGRLMIWSAGAAVVAMLAMSTAVLAQQDDEFVPMTAEQMAQAQESLPATPFVFAAYAVAWVALLGYVFVLWRKQGRIEEELRRVRAELEGGGGR